MFYRKAVLIAGAVAVIALLSAVSSQAWSPLTRPNYLSFTRSVALPGVVLAPGSYTFELASPGMNLDVVRVSSRDGRLIYFTGFTRSVVRPHDLPRGKTIMFGEAAAGEATPIAVWYPMDGSNGHEFIYR
jgi:hypothetical protein